MKRFVRAMQAVFTRAPTAPQPHSPVDRTLQQRPNPPLDAQLDRNIAHIHHALGEETPDLVVRRIQPAHASNRRAAVCYFENMANTQIVKEFLLEPLLAASRTTPRRLPHHGSRAYIDAIVQLYLPMGDYEIVEARAALIDKLLSGKVVLLFDGCPHAGVFEARAYPTRGIEEPPGEKVLRGPRDGFNESIRDCVSLIRRRNKSEELRIEPMRIGRRSKTDVALVYFKDVANDAMLDEARRRLGMLDIDTLTSASDLAQFIEESPHSPFPTHGLTERPDLLQRLLAEGRLAIVVDGSPQVLFVPHLFYDNFLTAEDLITRVPYASLVKMFRLIGTFVALTLPSVYIAITTFHHEVLPTDLAITVAAAREGVPFPAFVEALIMEIVIEIIREGSGRLPGPLGQTIGIVGALILGEAAITAGLVSPLLVIVVALTTLANFIIPNSSAAQGIRVLRFPFMIAAGVIGLPGLSAALIVLSIHLVGLHSFGIPYMTPWAPLRGRDLIETVFKKPVWAFSRRPTWLHTQDSVQQGEVYLRDWNAPVQRRQAPDRQRGDD